MTQPDEIRWWNVSIFLPSIVFLPHPFGSPPEADRPGPAIFGFVISAALNERKEQPREAGSKPVFTVPRAKTSGFAAPTTVN
jgi:hypothetical protein